MKNVIIPVSGLIYYFYNNNNNHHHLKGKNDDPEREQEGETDRDHPSNPPKLIMISPQTHTDSCR